MRTRMQQSHSPIYAHVMSAIILVSTFLFFQLIIGIPGALLLVGSIVGGVILVEWNRTRSQQANGRVRQAYIAWYKDQQRKSQNSVPPKQSQQQPSQQSNPFWGGDLDEFYVWDTDDNSF